MTADTARDHEFRSPHEIFELLDKQFRLTVVARALEHRPAVSEGVRRRLDGCVQALQVNGFRNAIKAPPEKLQRPILDAIGHGDRQLAGAVLNAWMESHQALRETSVAHLTSRGIHAPGGSGACFDASWTNAEWLREGKAIMANDPTLDEQDVGLMVCLTSRRFPTPQTLKSPLFRDWLDQLRKLPPNANEWAEAGTFTKWVDHVFQEKQGELHHQRVKEIKCVCDDIGERFHEDLCYLGIDPSPWRSEVEQRPALAGRTLEFTRTLRDGLEEYHLLRPQAANRAEELQRSGERNQLEEVMLRFVTAWQELLKQIDPAEEPAPEAGDPATARPVVEEPADDDQTAFDRLKDERDRFEREVSLLREEKDRVQGDNRGLQFEKEQQALESRRLKDELAQSRTKERSWRQAWIEGQRSRAQGDKPRTVNSVRDAIDLARQMFPDRLLIQLNSKSEQDTLFENPEEVLHGLEWLATAYRTGPHDSLAEDCPGWSYKPNQAETTMGRFPDWYKAQVNGKTWELSKHIGTGAGHDPRHIIRIAFAWDESNKRVIVGYVGPHQRSLQS